MTETLEKLARLIEQRKQADPGSSYVAGLQHKGLDKILEKVGEECTETLLAAKNAERDGDASQLVAETADLWFHTLVMLAQLGVGPEQVLSELERRFGVSGLDEKASRDKT